MKREEIEKLENNLENILNQVRYFKNNPTIENTEYTDINSIEAFTFHISNLKNFMKSIRPNGWLGISPQKQEDLDKSDEILWNLGEAQRFVEEMYKKHKMQGHQTIINENEVDDIDIDTFFPLDEN